MKCAAFLKLMVFRLLFASAILYTVSGASVFADVTLPDSLNGGFTIVRPVENYNPSNLYELINGQAVFYLSYGFVTLHHAFYQKGGNTYKVDVYQVQDALSAMGCYREQMDESAGSLGAGTEGYILEYLAAFYKDVHYIEIVPENTGVPGDMRTLAEQVDALLPGTAELPRELSLFPKEGLIEWSETYFGADLLSYSFLGRGLSANYRQNSTDRELRVFFAIAENPEGAVNMLKVFAERVSSASDITLTGTNRGVRGELPYRGVSMLFTSGRYAYGCIGVADQDQAAAILGNLQANLAAFSQ